MKLLRNILIALGILIVCFAVYTVVVITHDRCTLEGHKTVICIPVYGQSLALGEEAVRVTNFDSLKLNNGGRIVTENLDYSFGYIDDELSRQKIKKFIHYDKRAFELSSYRMAEELVSKLGKDTIICIFPGGTGMSKITVMNKTTQTYNKFLVELRNAYQKARERGWDFYVPAICWMQGESDIIEYSEYNYKQLLKQFKNDINKDIKQITKQAQDIPLIIYQSNVITFAEKYNHHNYELQEAKVPQSYVDLIREDSSFWASGPTYPYTFVNERLHIDAIGQQHIGYLDAIAVMNIIKGKEKTYGLTPQSLLVEGNDILVKYRVQYPPLVFDTISVKYANHYGFSVINKKGCNILKEIFIEGDIIRLKCEESPTNCKVRYAINGEKKKSGKFHGPRGNLRDSQGEKEFFSISGKTYPVHNWAYQFDMLCE